MIIWLLGMNGYIFSGQHWLLRNVGKFLNNPANRTYIECQLNQVIFIKICVNKSVRECRKLSLAHFNYITGGHIGN